MAKQKNMVANRPKPEPTEEEFNEAKVEIEGDPTLPDKATFRVDEVARYFDVSRATIKNWIDHNLLTKEKHGGIDKVTRISIVRFRLNGRFGKQVYRK